jgi:3-oxoacyl-[acyl-carrier protein] reductase
MTLLPQADITYWRQAFGELKGRKVLVTGGSTGIGAAVAQAFGACGAEVAVHYHSSHDAAARVVEAITASGARGITVQADLSEDGEAASLVRAVAAEFDGLDLLINNAGSILGRTPTLELSQELYQKIIDLNLTATFLACQAAIPVFKQRVGGAIINTTSLAARMGGGPGTVAYAAAKAGISTMTRGLAKEFAKDRIRVNAVAPGFIRTPLHERYTAPEVLETFRESIPMRRLGEPEDCVGAYLFLACERLSGYVTGQTIEVNGGIYMP